MPEPWECSDEELEAWDRKNRDRRREADRKDAPLFAEQMRFAAEQDAEAEAEAENPDEPKKD